MEYGQTAMAFIVHDESFSHERDSLVFKLDICILKTNKQKRKKERKGVKIQGNKVAVSFLIISNSSTISLSSFTKLGVKKQQLVN